MTDLKFPTVRLVLLSITLIIGAGCAESKNILVFGAIGSHSIRLSMWPVMEALAEKGHNVTFLSSYDNFEDPKNKSKIISYTPKKLKETMGSWIEVFDFYTGRKNNEIPFTWMQVQTSGILACEVLYSEPEFVDFVKTSHFDVVIVEMLVNECAYGLAHMWNAKIIMYSSTSVVPWFGDAHAFPDETSSITEIHLGFPPGEKMSFLQRFINTLSPIVFTLSREWSYLPKLEEITRKGLGLRVDELPSFREIEKNTSLVLLTTHFSLDYPRSLPPYAIPVGGTVVTKQKKPMPKDMEDFINSATKGFIYISFGTMADFTRFPKHIQINFINALENFPEIKFIWKSQNAITVKELPKNVFVTKWAPQQTLLGHPKIKSFISHGGMGSITEVVHFSVPLICIPVMAEQDMNGHVLAERDAGLTLELIDLTQKQVEHAIHEILYNSKYRMGMTRLTKIFNDRPNPPLESAIWWIEYILRHDNTNEFLRPPSITLPWWKRRNIDIWFMTTLILVGLPLLLLVTFYKIVSTILSSKRTKPPAQHQPNQAQVKKRAKYD